METADVLIVGGGLVGCAAAWHLARGGASVLLVERGELNGGASGQNAGSLHFQMERRFLENGEALADQAARTMALNRIAIDEWRGLEAALGASLDISMSGGLMVAETDAEITTLETKVARERQWGLPSRLIDGDEARSIAPYLSDTIRAAGYLDCEGHANPRIIARRLAAAAADAGARVLTSCTLSALERSARGFVATLDHGSEKIVVAASTMLVAAGAWTAHVGAMANLHLPIFPVALGMNVTERVAPVIPHLIQHVGRRLSMKQAHAGNILIGGGWPARLVQQESGGFDLSRPPAPIATSISGNLAVARSVVPMVAGLNLIRSWTGIVAITADQLPIVGAIPNLPGFHVAAGGSAFTLGPTFARLISAQILGGDGGAAEEQLALFSPARFNHLNSFMGAH